MAKQLAIAGIAALALATVCIVAVSERGVRSPSALLENGQKLYPYQYYYPYNQYPYQPDPYGYGAYGAYPYGYGAYPYAYGGYYPAYPYPAGGDPDSEAYRQWAAYAQQQQYADYVNQAQGADYASQQAYINQVNAYNQYAAAAQASKAVPSGLKVAKAPSLVYMGDFEMGGYTHPTTGGNDGGYNAPYDLNGDGQYVDNWGKVATQWKHKKGSAQLKKAGGKTQQKQSQLKLVASGKAKKADKQEFQLEQRKLVALAEANKLQKLSQARRTQALGSMDQPDDYYWQQGFNSGHPGAIPHPEAPFRPWYWKLVYDKYGHVL